VSTAERLIEQLAFYLGPHTARVAVRTFCESALGMAPEAMKPADLDRLLPALRPMLRTLLGGVHAEDLIAVLHKELR
jgi:hypothetical protein